MSRKKIITIVVILVLISVLIFYFFIFKKTKTEFEGESFITGESETIEKLSLIGNISNINVEDSFLMVKPINEDREVKVFISATTKLIKLEAPFSPDAPPPPGTQFVPEKKEITIYGFREGDNVLIMANQDITGKEEIDNVSLVQISI